MKPLDRILSPILKSSIAFWGKRRLPETTGRKYVKGLEGPIQIRRDEWGIPHIKASGRSDLFFAQGFIHAQDRLWQLELLRLPRMSGVKYTVIALEKIMSRRRC